MFVIYMFMRMTVSAKRALVAKNNSANKYGDGRPLPYASQVLSGINTVLTKHHRFVEVKIVVYLGPANYLVTRHIYKVM